MDGFDAQLPASAGKLRFEAPVCVFALMRKMLCLSLKVRRECHAPGCGRATHADSPAWPQSAKRAWVSWLVAIIDENQQGARRTAPFKPLMRAAVDLITTKQARRGRIRWTLILLPRLGCQSPAAIMPLRTVSTEIGVDSSVCPFQFVRPVEYKTGFNHNRTFLLWRNWTDQRLATQSD